MNLLLKCVDFHLGKLGKYSNWGTNIKKVIIFIKKYFYSPRHPLCLKSKKVYSAFNVLKSHIQDLAAASSSRKDATATLLDISISDSSFVIHSSKEHLLCNNTNLSKNIRVENACISSVLVHVIIATKDSLQLYKKGLYYTDMHDTLKKATLSNLNCIVSIHKTTNIR